MGPAGERLEQEFWLEKQSRPGTGKGTMEIGYSSPGEACARGSSPREDCGPLGKEEAVHSPW